MFRAVYFGIPYTVWADAVGSVPEQFDAVAKGLTRGWALNGLQFLLLMVANVCFYIQFGCIVYLWAEGEAARTVACALAHTAARRVAYNAVYQQRMRDVPLTAFRVYIGRCGACATTVRVVTPGGRRWQLHRGAGRHGRHVRACPDSHSSYAAPNGITIRV